MAALRQLALCFGPPRVEPLLGACGSVVSGLAKPVSVASLAGYMRPVGDIRVGEFSVRYLALTP
jgi:hypothetical protein